MDTKKMGHSISKSESDVGLESDNKEEERLQKLVTANEIAQYVRTKVDDDDLSFISF